jgi:hypothetical protein
LNLDNFLCTTNMTPKYDVKLYYIGEYYLYVLNYFILWIYLESMGLIHVYLCALIFFEI